MPPSLSPPFSVLSLDGDSPRFKSEAFSGQRDVAVAVAVEERGNGSSCNGDSSFSKSESA